MIDALIRWSLHNKLIVLTLAAILLAWGAWQAVRLPVDVLPDLTAPTVTILAEGGGIAPEEMESLVTFPIEAALNGAAGVRRVRSVTAVGDFNDVNRLRMRLVINLARIFYRIACRLAVRG